jgi:hypothetical protein
VPFEIAFQRMQAERWQLKGFDRFCRIEHRQNLLDFAQVFGIYAAAIVVFEKLAQCLVFEAFDHSRSPNM